MPEDNKELQNDRFNDLDVEIVNLDEETPDEKDVRHLSPHVRFSSRQRNMQVIATVSVVMLALLLIGANDSAIRNIFVPLPSPTATIPLGTDRFYVNAEPGWGHLFVDGKLVKHVPNADDNKCSNASFSWNTYASMGCFSLPSSNLHSLGSSQVSHGYL